MIRLSYSVITQAPGSDAVSVEKHCYSGSASFYSYLFLADAFKPAHEFRYEISHLVDGRINIDRKELDMTIPTTMNAWGLYLHLAPLPPANG